MSEEKGAVEGLAVVDKEAGWTSHDVVAKARGVLGTRKIGHSGTLDPDATGVLLLGVGRATRLLRFLTPLVKQYEAELVLGVETTTLDAAGEVTAIHDMAGIGPQEVAAAAADFVGDIMQVPPMVSAVKVGGRRLHELARQGIEVERKARPVIIHDLVVAPVGIGTGVYRMEVSCSSGTYIRSLGADIARALGGGGHVRALRRLAIGSFTVSEAHPVDSPVLLPMGAALRDHPAVTAGEDLGRRVIAGQVLGADELGGAGGGPWPVLDSRGRLLAVYEPYTEGWVKPAVVISP
ncbi:tRNA pseudouridine(55) synthase TruB [Candidatus Poriferisocius sp.]|uniref:tRNA pseudouridine(55) synthase TruB n=1 Tax=Candidatus Poriferisocius sp. TaxID=3101276 RepID=UPI003B021032